MEPHFKHQLDGGGILVLAAFINCELVGPFQAVLKPYSGPSEMWLLLHKANKKLSDSLDGSIYLFNFDLFICFWSYI